MINYSIDCTLTFQGNIDSVKLQDFQSAPGYNVRIRQGAHETNLTYLSDNMFDLDFILYRRELDAEAAEVFAYASMSKAIAYPPHLSILASDIQGVYNEDTGHWETDC